MAYLLIRRLWHGELVPLHVPRTRQGHALAMWAVAFCDRRKRAGTAEPGDIHIDALNDKHFLLTESVILPVAVAQEVLEQLEILPAVAEFLISDRYADASLAVLQDWRLAELVASALDDQETAGTQ